ncbi:MAG: amidohydrolase family protein [Ilumatobacteraceae bacterium]
MPTHELVIRGGLVADGTGMPARRADVAIDAGRIVAVGSVGERGHREIDAEGHVVSPGFVDGHTHLDAQMFWDPLGTSSCWHGVTTAVMGNCGFTLAPSREGQRKLVIDNLERAEDIPAAALEAGVRFEWETFREYLDVLDRMPKGINTAVYVGHSALRTFVMGERAFAETADADDLAAMERELIDGLRAGAVGFTTSRSDHHVTPSGAPVASRVASWAEVEQLVASMGRAGGGVFELSNESAMASPDREARADPMRRLRELAVSTGVPTTFGITTYGDPNRWQELLGLLDDAATDGGQLWGQSSCQPSGAVFNFATWLPFDKLAGWGELRRRPLAEQAVAIRDPEVRRRLVAEVGDRDFTLGKEAVKKSFFERLVVMGEGGKLSRSLAAVAAERGVHPVEAMLDLGLESDFGVFFFQPTSNDDPDDVKRILDHPRTVMTFSDAGAHASQIINASLPTHLLGVWVRERQVFALEHAVRMLTLVPASVWGFADRGLVREGFVADLNVFDPVTVGECLPEVAHDLPSGAVRLTQRATGFLATVVGGRVLLDRGEHTGELPGALVRRGLHRLAP